MKGFQMNRILQTLLLVSIFVFNFNSCATDFSSLFLETSSKSNYSNEEDNGIKNLWEIGSFTSKDKNVTIVEDYPGEKRIDFFNKLLALENSEYIFFKLEPNKSIELDYFWVNYHEKKESPFLPKNAQKADFSVNLKPEHNLVMTQKENGIIITNKNNYPVEGYLGFDNGFGDITLFLGDVQKRIAYVRGQDIKTYQLTEVSSEKITALSPYLMIIILGGISLYRLIVLLIHYNAKRREKMHHKNDASPSNLVT